MKKVKACLVKLMLLCGMLGVHLSCKKEGEELTPQKVNKMVLVYMEANNDLRAEALNSIDQMEKAAANLDGVLLVYLKTSTGSAQLLKIKHDTQIGKIGSEVLKTFVANTPMDPVLMKEVITEAQTAYPAAHYGLVLWSHATAWAPPKNNGIRTESFGRDGGVEMDLIDLKNALPNNLEFILFDACNMGGVEVLYELKDKAQYILASPTETLAESFPYQKITPLLFQGPDQLKEVAQQYYNYYQAYADDRQSAAVVLVKTSELEPLAQQMKNLVQLQKVKGSPFIREQVQRLDFTVNFPVANYDFGDFLDKNFAPNELSAIKQQLQKTILYKQATAKFLGVPIYSFSGLSCYIPYKEDGQLGYYKKLQWYQGSGLSLLFGEASF